MCNKSAFLMTNSHFFGKPIQPATDAALDCRYNPDEPDWYCYFNTQKNGLSEDFQSCSATFGNRRKNPDWARLPEPPSTTSKANDPGRHTDGLNPRASAERSGADQFGITCSRICPDGLDIKPSHPGGSQCVG